MAASQDMLQDVLFPLAFGRLCCLCVGCGSRSLPMVFFRVMGKQLTQEEIAAHHVHQQHQPRQRQQQPQ